MEKHAKYSPSKLARILACPASAQINAEMIEQKPSIYAEEGTMLHKAVEAGLKAFLKGGSWALSIDFLNLTREQIDAVEECILYGINLIQESWDQYSKDTVAVLVEKRVYIAQDCDGTCDLGLITPGGYHAVDWKFGQGVEVSAQENPQGLAYLVGLSRNYIACTSFQKTHWEKFATIHIVQPRLNNFDTYTLSIKDLDRWLVYKLLPGLELAASENAPFCPSLEACRWCPQKTLCSARLEMAISNAEKIFVEHAKMPNISLEAIKKLLPMAKQVEVVIKDLTLFAQQQLSDGKEVPGYKLVRGRSNRVWDDKKIAGEFLATYLEPEEMYEMKMVTPAKAEKLLDRSLRKDDDFLSLIKKPEGKVTLVPDSDKRQAISLDAESVFANHISNN